LIRDGELVDPREGAVTVKSWSEGWLDKKRASLAPSTNQTYADVCRLHISPHLGHIRLSRLVPSDIKAWQELLADPERTSIAKGKGGQPTRAKAYRVLREMLELAVVDRIIPNNPCIFPQYAKEGSPERKIPRADAVPLLVSAMPERERSAVLLACWCQLRLGEVLGLRRKAFNFAEGKLMVSASAWYARNGSIIEKSPKSEAGKRSVTIPSWILPAIIDHFERFVAPEPDALVFVGARSGNRLRSSLLERHWRAARALVGCNHVTIHDMRHAGGTFASIAGATVPELMKRLGHSTPGAALRYQHMAEGRDAVIAEGLSVLAERAETKTQDELVKEAEALLRNA
jgi:integrase